MLLLLCALQFGVSVGDFKAGTRPSVLLGQRIRPWPINYVGTIWYNLYRYLSPCAILTDTCIIQLFHNCTEMCVITY